MATGSGGGGGLHGQWLRIAVPRYLTQQMKGGGVEKHNKT
jgi:hypothetical protein